MNSRLVIAAIEADGWVKVGQKGCHVQFRHPAKPGRVSVPHPKGMSRSERFAASRSSPDSS